MSVYRQKAFAIDQNTVSITIILPLMYSCKKRTARQFTQGLYRKTPAPAKPSTAFGTATPFTKIAGGIYQHNDQNDCLNQQNITPNNQKMEWLGKGMEKLQYTFNSRLEQPKVIELSSAGSSLKAYSNVQTSIASFGFLEGTYVGENGKIVKLQDKMGSIFDDDEEFDDGTEQDETEFTYSVFDDEERENKAFYQEDQPLQLFARPTCIFESKFKDQESQKPVDFSFSTKKKTLPFSNTALYSNRH